jgi:DNA-binding GntR family transcriptional regulator
MTRTHAVNPPAMSQRDPLPLSRALLKDRAYEELKAMIQTGVFPPNAFLSERQLVLRLGMSKTPIRSALEHLEAQGLVVVSPRQGIVVKELSAREITDLFDMRSAIEPFVASRLAARSLGPADRTRIAENLDRQRDAVAAADAPASTRLDVEFHALLAELVDNREASAWLARCFDKLHRSILRVNKLAAGQLDRSREDHEAIARAILARDPEAASRLMAAHLLYGQRFLLGG